MRFQLFQASNGDWRWRLLAANGRVIADSGEGYRSKADAQHGIELVAATTKDTPVSQAKAV